MYSGVGQAKQCYTEQIIKDQDDFVTRSLRSS